ncbi:hypothetical protein [Streptomyces sp. NPDC050263]|uniref:hypothetical protein n=1 Tax=Streptomyces sp. NPDC050263 TaxID=3155037 RepID=UPI003414DB29
MGVSRRALLGYSSSAAAGAVLASAGPAQAEAETSAAAAGSGVAEQASETETDPDWGWNIPFGGVTPPGPEDGSIAMTFKIDFMHSPTAQKVTALDVANAINELITSRGWPAIQFYGHVPQALN